MRITFYGAAQEVTGSMILLEVNDQRILLECGLYQGRRADTYARNLSFPFDPAQIDTMVLSHAHIDHSGNIPNLVKQGYTGNIWCTAATRNLCTYMLLDAGHVLERDVAYINKARVRRGEAPVAPLYTQSDAQACLPQLVGIGLHRPMLIAPGVELRLYNAGHILGAAHVRLDIQDFASGKARSVVFSGDIGRSESPVLKPPEAVGDATIVIMESTYGDRLHESYDDARRRLRQVIQATARRRGKLIIPAFAVGRTQEIIYALNSLDAQGDIPELPLFVDSPLAVNATDVFRMHPEAWNSMVQAFLGEEQRKSPFDYPNVEYVRELRRSKQLNGMPGPAVIISASGMAESGRILHHLKHNIGDPENTILLVSYMAQDTLGRRLKDGAERVRIFGDEYVVRAEVVAVDGYSAHADQAELLAWVGQFDRNRLDKLFVVHGEPAPASVLATEIERIGLPPAIIPSRGDQFEF
jgi:metallo-beta-lactamase family protein